ncbi:MAG: hypothetical protein HYX39_03510 [Bacteroidetes bacterium]|nr:hypothetical protein [Bacteroidota bacterium]
MMRFLICIFFGIGVFISCAPKQRNSRIPSIVYKDFKAYKVNGSDTAVMIIAYADGDGDIFRDNNSSPNFIGTFYYLNSATKQFTPLIDIVTKDTARITQTILQPKDNSYKGKSVQGEMFIPFNPFRSGDSVKTFKYTLFMVDQAGNKSNVITTPVYNIDF